MLLFVMDMNILYVIFEVLNILLLLHTAYFALFALAGLFRSTRIYGDTDALRHFAVLIAARNEEAVIGNLVSSIKAADYPADLLDVYVIVNNTTDDTAGAAASAGAAVMQCTVPVKSKAEVLDFAFDRLKSRDDIDTYVVFDADNVVDPGFFREINKAFASGARAAQCKRTGKNTGSTWVSACYEIYYSMQNAFFNHPRNAAGLTAAVNGTGWAIDKDIIDEYGFGMMTIAEDHEFTVWCAMNDIQIAYCSKALTYDEYTVGIKASLRQRLRWSFGMLQIFRKYEWPVVKASLRGSRRCFDMAMLNLLPIITLVSIFTTVLAYVFVDIPMAFVPFILGLIAASWVGSSAGALVSVMKSGCSVKDNIKGIIAFPAFIVTWAPLIISCFFRRDMVWAPIKHDQSVSIDDVRRK